MLETYKLFRNSTEMNFTNKTNEELVRIYKGAKNEYERSQSIGAIFVKNFPAFIRVTSKYNHVDSSEKAGMITSELVGVLNDYNEDTSKFITYLMTRIENLFLWDYTNNKNKINMSRNTVSINQTADDEDGEPILQIEDSSQRGIHSSILLHISIKNAMENEFKKLEMYKEGLTEKEYKKDLAQLNLNKAVLEILSEDATLDASQIARRLGLFTKKEEYEVNSRKPEVVITEKVDNLGNTLKDKFGRTILTATENTLVRKVQWSKIQESVRMIRKMFVDYNICQNDLSM
ncbi:MAG: hypothetical protein RR342_01595 [Bacilli bacterium]